MHEHTPRIRTERTVELPAHVVAEIAEELAHADGAPTEEKARDLAFDHLEVRTEFVTEDGEQLVDAVEQRV